MLSLFHLLSLVQGVPVVLLVVIIGYQVVVGMLQEVILWHS
jgi:hypothetical protein